MSALSFRINVTPGSHIKSIHIENAQSSIRFQLYLCTTRSELNSNSILRHNSLCYWGLKQASSAQSSKLACFTRVFFIDLLLPTAGALPLSVAFQSGGSTPSR